MFGLFEVHWAYYKFTELVCVSQSFTLLQEKACMELAGERHRFSDNVGLIDASEEEDNIDNHYYVILPIEVL